MKAYLQYDGLEVLAHRGGAEESYENTLESFDYSKNLGCKFIETDVQVSSDGIPYISVSYTHLTLPTKRIV